MEREGIGSETSLVRLCIEAASENQHSVNAWKGQRRSLDRLPPQLSHTLLHRLLQRKLLIPSLLEVFKCVIEEIDMKGQISVDSEWMAYIGAFKYLCSLNIADCHRISDSALWFLAGMENLKEVNLSRCGKVKNAGIKHLLSIPTIEKLWVSETGLTAKGISHLSSLKRLTLLDLGGLPVTDEALNSLQVLKRLQYLDLWGSRISDKGVAIFSLFSKLTFLNLAWTAVTKLPNLPSVTCLNMSNCRLHSVFQEGGCKNALVKLIISGATLENESEAFFYVETASLHFLDVSNTSLGNFSFLPHMKTLKHLDLSFTSMGDDSVEFIASIGMSLIHLNLNNTRISTSGIQALAGRAPNLEVISLSETHVDDFAIIFISMFPALKFINLSKTNIRGYIDQEGAEPDRVLSLTDLQDLKFLEILDLEETQVGDDSLSTISGFLTLSHLSLKSVSLTDMTLHHLSSLPNLTTIAVQWALLSNGGLCSFKPPVGLKLMDLRGCWLLTEDAILAFCKHHPLIEVRHELVHIIPSEHKNSVTLRTSTIKHQREKVPSLLSGFIKQSFIDQRLKYNREEMLSLQTSPHSTEPPKIRGTTMPSMLVD